MKATGILLLFLLHDAASVTNNITDNKCGSTLDAGSLKSLILSLDAFSGYGYFRSCSVRVKTSPDSRIMFYFMNFNVGKSSNCTSYNDRLEVRDGNSSSSPYVSDLHDKLCGTDMSGRVYETSGNYLYLDFFMNSWTSANKVDLVITSFHTGDCRSDEYSCSNGRCISDSLRCNGYNPCGDSSDCYMYHENETGAIVAILVGAFFLLVFLIVLLICLRRRRLTYVLSPSHEPVYVNTTLAVTRYEKSEPQPYPQQYPALHQYPVPKQYPKEDPIHPVGQVPKY